MLGGMKDVALSQCVPSTAVPVQRQKRQQTLSLGRFQALFLAHLQALRCLFLSQSSVEAAVPLGMCAALDVEEEAHRATGTQGAGLC